jgi:hypothetical protein
MKHDPADDALEAELHSLRPRELPDDLVRGIEASLADESGKATGKPATWLRVAAAAVGLAACVAVASLLWRGGRGGAPTDPAPVAVTPGPAESRTAQSGRPDGVTLAEYRAAFARSPAAMDALLEQDAPRPMKPARRTASFRAFHGPALDLTAPGDP